MSNLDLSREFAGQKALITGGTSGLGAATARRLIDAGAKVVVTGRTRHAETPEDAIFVDGDLRNTEGVEKATTAGLEALGGLDLLVNSAGATRVHWPNSEAISDEEWLDSINVNFLSAVRVTYAVLSELKKSKRAAIVNISSGGKAPYAGALLHYGAAKAALNHFTAGLAKELAPIGIRVNTVTPGAITTPGGDELRVSVANKMNMSVEEFVKVLVPLEGRVGQPEEVAEMVTFLLSPRTSYVTGHNHYVSGGWGELTMLS